MIGANQDIFPLLLLNQSLCPLQQQSIAFQSHLDVPITVDDACAAYNTHRYVCAGSAGMYGLRLHIQVLRRIIAKG